MNLNVPADVHHQFKAATAAEGKDMTAVLLRFIEEYVRDHSPAVRPAKKGGRS